MAKGDVFEVGDAIRVKLSTPRDSYGEYVIDAITRPGEYPRDSRGRAGWPWPERTKLLVSYWQDAEQRWKDTWFHADDPDVRPCPDSKLLQLRAAQALLGEHVDG